MEISLSARVCVCVLFKIPHSVWGLKRSVGCLFKENPSLSMHSSLMKNRNSSTLSSAWTPWTQWDSNVGAGSLITAISGGKYPERFKGPVSKTYWHLMAWWSIADNVNVPCFLTCHLIQYFSCTSCDLPGLHTWSLSSAKDSNVQIFFLYLTWTLLTTIQFHSNRLLLCFLHIIPGKTRYSLLSFYWFFWLNYSVRCTTSGMQYK